MIGICKIVKFGPVDAEIIGLRAIKKKEKIVMQAKHIALSASLPSGLNKTIADISFRPQSITHNEYLFVLIVKQNSVGIGEVVMAVVLHKRAKRSITSSIKLHEVNSISQRH